MADRVAAVLALRSEGLSLRETAAKLDVSYATVARDLKRAARPPAPEPEPEPDPEPEVVEPDPVPEATTNALFDEDMGDLPAWYGQAACLGLPAVLGRDPWFAKSQGARADDARDYCNPCPVREPCRDYALEQGIRDGIWGGLTPKQRATLTRRAG